MPHRQPINPRQQDAEFVANAIAILSAPAKRTRNLMRVANLIYYAIVLMMLGWLISQALDRAPPIKVFRANIKTDIIYPGEQLKVEYVLRRDRLCESSSTWAFYDGSNEVRRFGPNVVISPGKLGLDTFIRSYTVPSNSAPGPARLSLTLAWQCPGNYLHPIYPIVMTLEDIHFTIIPRQPEGPSR